MTIPELTTSCVVIGAGQAGLSVAYFLRRLGLEAGQEFVLIDRGPGTGGAWQHRWEALRLGSAHRVNDLPGMDELGLSFTTADHHAPARDVVADYYARYEQHYGLQVVRPASVTHVEDQGRDLLVRLTTENGPLERELAAAAHADEYEDKWAHLVDDDELDEDDEDDLDAEQGPAAQTA